MSGVAQDAEAARIERRRGKPAGTRSSARATPGAPENPTSGRAGRTRTVHRRSPSAGSAVVFTANQ
jgi:hypothetical protein